jgi:hypothetical protein
MDADTFDALEALVFRPATLMDHVATAAALLDAGVPIPRDMRADLRSHEFGWVIQRRWAVGGWMHKVRMCELDLTGAGVEGIRALYELVCRHSMAFVNPPRGAPRRSVRSRARSRAGQPTRRSARTEQGAQA